MLDILEKVLTEELPHLLDSSLWWDSLIINKRKPYTYRLFTYLDTNYKPTTVDKAKYRICLHKFDSCTTEEAFYHPHPWPAAFIILAGSYDMQIGFTSDRESTAINEVTKLKLNEGCKYEIVNCLTWHKINPLELTYTVMINSNPWPNEVAHTAVRRTAGKDLDKLGVTQLQCQLAVFKILLRSYNNYESASSLVR
jgi:hypothetical protein